MSEETVVGQLKGPRDPFHIEWEVDFLSLRAEVDKNYQSPIFFFYNSSWYLNLYPIGQKSHSSEGYVGVFVKRRDSDPPVPVIYSLFLKKTDGRKVIWEEESHTFQGKDHGHGKSKAMRRSELIDQKSVFFPTGVLTLILCLKCDETQVDEADLKTLKESAGFMEASTQTQSEFCTEKLLVDLSELLLCGDCSDFTIEVKGAEFHLHRGILSARTPVFQSMFKHNMTEKETGRVSVDDCEVDTFRVFVQYLYTGRTDQLNTDIVFGLFALADKYQVDELKSACIAFIKSNLSVETFCDTVQLSLKYDNRELLEQAIDLLAVRTSEVLKTVKWMNFLAANHIQANELLLKALDRKQQGNSMVTDVSNGT